MHKGKIVKTKNGDAVEFYGCHFRIKMVDGSYHIGEKVYYDNGVFYRRQSKIYTEEYPIKEVKNAQNQ